MRLAGSIGPTGELALELHRPWPAPAPLRRVLRHALPWPGLSREVNLWRLKNLPNLWRGLWRVVLFRAISRLTGHPFHYGALWLTIKHADGSETPLGLASLRVVTTAGATKIVDFLRALDTIAAGFKYHGFGTGGTAEAAGDTALVTEETTQYAVDNTRPTGSQTNNGATVYRTVGTYSPDSGGTRAITEHGIFSANSGVTLLDRSLFSVVNIVAAQDSLQATYDFTVNTGG